MKICFISSAASVHTVKWVDYYHDRGHEVHLISPKIVAGVGLSLPAAQMHQYDAGGGRIAQFAGAYRVLRMAVGIDADITHVHSLFFVHPLFFAFWNRMLGPVRNLFVSTWGADIAPELPNTQLPFLDRFSKRCQLSQAAVITATSSYLARCTSAVFAGREVKVIPFGVDCVRFSPKIKPVRSGIRLCFIKHLSRKYGPEYLLRALRIVRARFPQTALVMAGSGPLAEELCGLVRQLGLEDVVMFPGEVPNSAVPDILADSDIFVMPSVCYESFGVAAVEAQAMGVPVVASSVGGVPEVLRDGETGLLVPPGDTEKLAAAIIKLIESPPLRESMGKAGRARVLKYYNFDDNAAAMESLYREIIDAGSERNS